MMPSAEERRGSVFIALNFCTLPPTTNRHEEDQYQAYTSAIKRCDGRPLVIRTLDLGADKFTQAKNINPERNPFLGDRSIRMCLHDIPMFKRQLRAIMRCQPAGRYSYHVPDDHDHHGIAPGDDGAP